MLVCVVSVMNICFLTQKKGGSFTNGFTELQQLCGDGDVARDDLEGLLVEVPGNEVLEQLLAGFGYLTGFDDCAIAG